MLNQRCPTCGGGTARSWVLQRSRIAALRAHVDRELLRLLELLALGRAESTELSEVGTAILAGVPASGWVQVAVLLKPVRASTRAQYAAVRELVQQGVLVRRHGYVARRGWVEAEQDAEDFGSGSGTCNTTASPNNLSKLREAP